MLEWEVPIFIEAAEWDSAPGFRDLEPVEVPDVIYQVHMYVPSEFTHQGVGNQRTGLAYPGTIGGVAWDKERLHQVLQPVREFQLAYNVHIYVGEFSAIRWAPGAADYLRDCIEFRQWRKGLGKVGLSWGLADTGCPAECFRNAEKESLRQASAVEELSVISGGWQVSVCRGIAAGLAAARFRALPGRKLSDVRWLRACGCRGFWLEGGER